MARTCPKLGGQDDLKNKGATILVLDDTNDPSRWTFGSNGGSFVVDNQANGGIEMSLSSTGNLVALGTITPGSSRTIKQDFVGVDGSEILAKVLALPISEWSYKANQGVRHIGPMAEDFYGAFSVGADDKGISVTDSAGVALAAIQGLHRQLANENAELRARIARLEQLLTAAAASPATP